MGSPYVGEIRMFAGNFAPQNWATCDGQLMSIAENEVLFVLIGTTYGGDGQTTFALPNLAARLPIHQGTLSGGQNYVQGQSGGVNTVTLTANQLPVHAHILMGATAAGNVASPSGAVFAASSDNQFAPDTATLSAMNAAAINSQGGNQPHDNQHPYLALSYIISLFGIFPSQG